MAGNHMRVLAEQIYNEQNTITYRLLSRMLGVHVNIAKQMLTEFHQQAKLEGKPCHATYVLSGLLDESPIPGTSLMHTDDDSFMSSPVATQRSSRSDGALVKRTRTIILADEDNVNDAKNKFSKLTSIHVYSLGPSTIPDAILLTTCSYDIAKKYNTLSPKESAETYGVILNPNAIKRQLTKYVPPAVVVATAASKPSTKLAPTKPAPTSTTTEPTPEETEKTAPEKNTSESTRTSSTTIKRTASGNIMSAFANAPPKKPASARKAEPLTAEDPEIKTEAIPSLSKSATRISAKRQQELDEINKMMEDDEPEELEDFPPDPPLEDSQDTSIALDSPAPVAADIAADEEAPKRKRGKRKVLRKTTKRDEKGYLVTKNEYIYESFSEDEDSDVAPKVANTAANPLPTNAGGDKKKGKANAAGQKSLMSFFGKK